MKLTFNNYLYSNFNTKFLQESISKSTLSINNIYNLTTRNNVIEPICDFSDLLSTHFEADTYNSIKEKYPNLLNNICKVYLYDYYDSTLSLITNRVFIIDNNYTLYEIDTISKTITDYNFQFASKPNALIANNKLYIYSHNDLFLMINSSNYPIILTDVVNLISLEDFNDYTFFNCIENKFSIFYTEKTELVNLESNLNNYNEIKMLPENGEVNKVFTYKNNLFVIQQYAISKILIDNDTYKIQSICKIKSTIDTNTIEMIDDYVIFLTSSGLYLFDGNDTKQIFRFETENLIHSNNKSVSYNNKYYLKTEYYINEIKENLILEFDIENENCVFYKIGNVEDIYLIQTLSTYKLIAIVNEDNNLSLAKFLDFKSIAQNHKYIKFNKLTFDDTPVKLLSEIKIISYGKFYLTISSEIQSSTFEIDGISYIRNIGIKGQAFEFEIFSDSNFKIESIYIKTTSYSED